MHEIRALGGRDYPRTFQEFREWFPDERSCSDYLARLRWPAGFVCPHCGWDDAWQVGPRRLWMCAGCSVKTSVTAGTIFHRSHTPLSTWFAAAWFVTSQKNGVSAKGLQDALGFGSYETAWAWLHKLRRAMVRPERDMLTGLVELDETFIGGRTSVAKAAATEKLPVIIAVERLGDNKLGRVRFGLPTRQNSTEQIHFACRTIAEGSTIRTDGLYVFEQLKNHGFTHEWTSGKDAVDKTTVLPGVHRVASLLKRWLAGTLHHAVSPEHLRYYLDEYAFRFNRRTSTARGMLFYRLLQQACSTDPHPFTELVGGST